MKLIRKYLQSGILINGVVTKNGDGTPQGGPLSPLLSNIMLDELDKELEKRGHKFCRYADDCNIYVKSERAGKNNDWTDIPNTRLSVILAYTQKWKNLINSIQNIVSKVLLEFNEKEMHLNYISGNFESKCNFQSIKKTVIPQFLKNIFIFKR